MGQVVLVVMDQVCSSARFSSIFPVERLSSGRSAFEEVAGCRVGLAYRCPDGARGF